MPSEPRRTGSKVLNRRRRVRGIHVLVAESPAASSGTGVSPLDTKTVQRYLDLLGCSDNRSCSLGNLRQLQRAHLNLIAYENVDIHLGRPPCSLNPADSVQRILQGRGGAYCYVQNGALAALLVSLGYDISLHSCAVSEDEADLSERGNHMAIVVHGYPVPNVAPDGQWVVDVGLGDGPKYPFPLQAQQWSDTPFTYSLEPRPYGWRFKHDQQGSFVGFNLEVSPLARGVCCFEENHKSLWTAEDSSFVKTLVLQRRAENFTITLRGCFLTRIDSSGKQVEHVLSKDEFFATMSRHFFINESRFTELERSQLWSRTYTAHKSRQQSLEANSSD
ncbi:hypothetical protein CYMTET_43999 [Cymbomonas tetramitiformis]|uniref:Arylamine N-acetyltransferase n=1 Tax=Cymbomonas tetramitiformis TaxID=36881 RepID=A0AAE0C2Z9_9CHLO|nr:hypothetical protein CYMTET_43999 [Cymbomonas tetramitiformis]